MDLEQEVKGKLRVI